MLYDRKFYADRHARTVSSARTVLAAVRGLSPKMDSVIDVGCGVGTWLATAKELGATHVLGVDGDWVQRDLLEIDAAEFKQHDLTTPLDVNDRFDLAISLEVAEHVDARYSATFVDNLTRVSDVILFSAAVPLQGGRGHVNEQWPAYWSELFAQRNYRMLDILRPRLWTDESVQSWYRQNVMLAVSEQVDLPRLRYRRQTDFAPLHVVHPDFYTAKVARYQQVIADSRKQIAYLTTGRGSLGVLKGALMRVAKRRGKGALPGPTADRSVAHVD